MEPILQLLESWSRIWALAILACAALGVRVLTRDPPLRADASGAAWMAIGALLLRLLERVLPVATAPTVKAGIHVVGLSLAAFAAIRLAVSIALWIARRQGHATPRILRDVLDGTLYVVAGAVILRTTFQLDLTAFVTTSALLSVVLGLALQDTLGNLFAGLSLQLERPVAPGDWVRLGEHEGKVVEISWRAIRIETRAFELVTIPNNQLAKNTIQNLSRALGGPVVCLVHVGLAYGAPPNLVKELLLGVLRDCPHAIRAPAPDVLTSRFAESSIDYELRFWVPRYEDLRRAEDWVRSTIWYRLRRAGLEIPFPVRTVYVRREPKLGLDQRTDTDGNVATGRELGPALLAIPFLQPLGEEKIRELGARARRLVFGRGERILVQGETGDTFFLVIEGEVEVHADGHGDPLARVGPGGWFGEGSMLTGEVRSAHVSAATDVALAVVDRESFAAVLQGNAEIAQALANTIAERRAAVAARGQPQEAIDRVRRDETTRVMDRLRSLFQLRGGPPA